MHLRHSANGRIGTQQIHNLKRNGGNWIVDRGRCSALVWGLDIVFVHEDIPAVEWAAEHDVKYFDGRTTWCWWETEAGFVIFRSMWRSYQGSVSLRNVYRKQACFRGCWHRAAVRLFAFTFDLWAGQWNKGRKPRTRPHCSADIQHHTALNPGLNPRSLPKTAII